jgi:hypothetical protein
MVHLPGQSWFGKRCAAFAFLVKEHRSSIGSKTEMDRQKSRIHPGFILRQIGHLL